MSNAQTNAPNAKDARAALLKKQEDQKAASDTRKAAFRATLPAVKTALGKLSPEKRKTLTEVLAAPTAAVKQNLEALKSKK